MLKQPTFHVLSRRKKMRQFNHWLAWGQTVFQALRAMTLLKCKNHSHLMVLTKVGGGSVPLAKVSRLRTWSREIWSLGRQVPSSTWASHLLHEIRGLDKGCFPDFNFFFIFNLWISMAPKRQRTPPLFILASYSHTFKGKH